MKMNSELSSMSRAAARARYSRYWAVICGDRNVPDVDLLLADQIEQQVERTLVGFQADIQRL